MLTAVLAHAGQPPQPHDLWTAWNLSPLLLTGLVLAWLAYHRGRPTGGRRPADVRRARCFAGALLALAVALVSPLDALGAALASAHMVQHVVVILVAAPLLALSAPSSALLRGSPLAVRRATSRVRHRLRPAERSLRVAAAPVTVWLLHVAVVWLWHASVLYDAAVANEWLHVLEHATFLVTGLWFWRVIIGVRGGAARVPHGLGILLVFAMAMQSVFLSVIMTFARTPWYASYATTTQPWGLDPLADQQLAGVIMWVPAGVIYLGVALALLAVWLRHIERDTGAPHGFRRAVRDRG
ncbi:MAG TPA: cytochrome c oxidase assembly protein [Euzebyales bacterium]